MATKTLTQSAQTAKLIRAELKKEFPTIKFNIRSRNFSMGDAVDIFWNLGPTTDEVNAFTNKYQYGHFDGMTDTYEHSNSIDDMPQAKFVHTERHYRSDEEVAQYKINEKLKWNDPLRIDMYKEEKTLYHTMARDLCKLIGIEYVSQIQILPREYTYQVTGFASPCVCDLVRRISQDTPLMEGYYGIKYKKNDEGQDITNAFEVY